MDADNHNCCREVGGDDLRQESRGASVDHLFVIGLESVGRHFSSRAHLELSKPISGAHSDACVLGIG